MLENLRDKLNNVQDFSVRSKKKTSQCRINAGSEFLNYYQNHWHSMHDMTEENAKSAERLANVMASIHERYVQHTTAIENLTFQMGLLPSLHKSLLMLMDKIGELEGLFGDIECALVNLEDTLETQQHQERQLDRRFQLALYERAKQTQLEQLKVTLANRHEMLLAEFEIKQNLLQKERQAVFQEAFEEEMNQYKVHGKIERVLSVPIEPAVDLASIVLDDPQEKDALDEFLEVPKNLDSFSETK